MTEVLIAIVAAPWTSQLCCLLAFMSLVNLAGTVGSRIVRAISISLNGWPPPHLDADGDFKKEETSS